MKVEDDLLEQLQLPVKEKQYSYDIHMPLRILNFMLTLVEIVNEASYHLRRRPQTGILEGDQQEIRKTRRRFGEKLKSINYSFIATHEKVQSLIRLIIRVRTEEIVEKIKAEEYLWRETCTDRNKHFFVLKQLYMKIFRIRNYIYYNEKRLHRIASSHELLATKAQQNLRLGAIDTSFLEQSSLEDRVSKIRKQLEHRWVKEKGGTKKSLEQLRRLAELVDRREISDKTKLGVWTGIMAFMALTVAFLIINYDINFTSQPQFELTFPIWRGVCYFILLFWLFAVQSYTFEKYGISFRMLTIMNNFYIPKYPALFVCAAFFTSVHLLMFMLYIFALAEFGISFPDNFELHYLPAISWILLFAFFCIPLPFFHFDKRMYPLFMLVRSLTSPIFGVEFKYHWWTEIWVSFRQPFRDLAFTFIYYFIDSSIVYQRTIIFETVAGVAIYGLRIIQNCRQMHQSKMWGGMPLYGSIKCALNIITVLTSYAFRVEENQLSMLPLTMWIISAIVSTSYAYYFDLKWDWGLLESNNYLRKEIIFGTRRPYYLIIGINLIFRFVWVLNISPDILRSIPLERYFLIMVVSSIEIVRRVVWSIFRIEKEHIMAEKYYDSIGITRNKEEEKKEVAYDELLVEIDDLNKTFSVENEKVMKSIYEDCEQEMLSPTRLKKRLHVAKGLESHAELPHLANATKSELLESLSQELHSAQQNYTRIYWEMRTFMEGIDQVGGTIIDFESDRYEFSQFE